MAAGDLTTLGNAKQWLGIDESDILQDAFIARLISASSSFIVSWIDANILLGTYSEKYSGRGKPILSLANRPIGSVSSLLINDVTIPADKYGIAASYVYLKSGGFPLGLNNISVTYTAGYTTVPQDIEQCVLELVGQRYKERQRIGISSQTLGGQQTISYFPRDLGDDVKKMLQNYRGLLPV